MRVFIKSDKLLRALRICGLLNRVWPLEDGAGRVQVISYKALLLIHLVNCFFVILALIRGMSYHRNDFSNMIKAVLELMYELDIVSSIFYCMMQEKRFRRLFAELECVDGRCSSSYEKILRQKYRFYLCIIYIVSLILYVISVVLYILTPLILSEKSFIFK